MRKLKSTEYLDSRYCEGCKQYVLHILCNSTDYRECSNCGYFTINMDGKYQRPKTTDSLDA